MSDQPEELDFEERRKRLEQLFSAEPFLSPTMKARKLSDTPEEQSNGHELNGYSRNGQRNHAAVVNR